MAKIFEQAGISRALVSSTPNDGTERLHEAMPKRVVPELRPYRTREDMASWNRDPTILPFIEERLNKGIYRGIGEFHLHGDDAMSEVVKKVVDLAVTRGLILHAHSDGRAVEHLFAANPKARVLWAHAGMSSSAQEVGNMLERHRNLWVELAIRSDVAPGGRLDPAWRALFLRFPDRILVGTDTWVASRWEEVVPLAKTTRRWLAELPREVAEKIAHKNAAALLGP
ncbi:MAG: amidohydrolase family protein [Betaproteobacteria bacterium]|nr:amidohydrolase family protein [Betaproteobacteria bacterium]